MGFSGSYSFTFNTDSIDELNKFKDIAIEESKKINNWVADGVVLHGKDVFLDDSYSMDCDDCYNLVLDICRKCIRDLPLVAFEGTASSGDDNSGWDDYHWLKYDSFEKKLTVYSVWGENLVCPDCGEDLYDEGEDEDYIPCCNYEPGKTFYCSSCEENVDPGDCSTFVFRNGELVEE